MHKHKYFLVLIAVAMIAVIGLAGCAPAAPAAPAAKPTINSFTASPASISQGASTTLSWDVSNATEVKIEPDIGSAGPSGSLQLTPDASVTYTLTASNSAGSGTASVSISVTPVVAKKADLEITDFWLAADNIYFKVKNQGVAASKPTTARIYVDGFEKDSKYIGTLDAGEEKTVIFSAYKYSLNVGWTESGYEFPSTHVEVCIDEDNTVAESNESNNCLSRVWGITEAYDFLYNAHLAEWRTSHGDLKWGGIAVDANGAAFTYLGELTTCPEQVSNGWILGKFADFYLDEESQAPSSREIMVPENAKFTAELGFRRGRDSTDGVKVALGYMDETYNRVMFPGINVMSDGQWHPYEVDLSDLAGKKTEFFLWVETNASPEGDCVSWKTAKIIQE